MSSNEDGVDKFIKEGFDSLFTNAIMQNLPGSFKTCFDRIWGHFDEQPYARRHSLLNLLGFLALKCEGNLKAISYFSQVIQKGEDPRNLNALFNIRFAYQDLGKRTEVKKYEEKIREIAALSEEDLLMVKARAKYELAEAMATVDGHKHIKQSLKNVDIIKEVYEEALEMANHCPIPKHERQEWVFGYAFFLCKCDSSHSSHDHIKIFEQSMSSFYQIVKAKPQPVDVSLPILSRERGIQQRNIDMIAKAWSSMGSLLSRREERTSMRLMDVLGEGNVSSDHKLYTLDSCMEMAVENSTEENKHVVLNACCQVFTELKRMEKAEECIDESIKLKKSGYSYELKGRLYLKMFKEKMSEKNYLHEAIVYFKKSMDTGCNLWHLYRDLADAYFLRGDNDDLDEALQMCFESKKFGGTSDKELYRLWIRIFKASGEEEAAHEKQAELEKLERVEVEDDYDFSAYYCETDIPVVAQIVSQLEKRYHLRGHFLDRMHAGIDFFDEWEMSTKSKLLLVFVSSAFNKTKHFLAKQTIKNVISSQHDGAMSNIIPVLFSGVEKFDLLPTTKPVKYDENNEDNFYFEIKKAYDALRVRHEQS